MAALTAESLASDLQAYVRDAATALGGDGRPIPPNHRVPFHWPPHPVSKDYHVLASDWTGKAELVLAGQVYNVQIARTAQGVFGRVEKVWNEAKGRTVEDVLGQLKTGAEPFFERQRAIAKTLGRDVGESAPVASLGPLEHLKLLYCPDRDVAHEAQLAIESHASSGLFAPALVSILLDESHPYRRSAQWCVLDMFEDLPSFCTGEAAQKDAVDAIQTLIWNAQDDYARTIYKAGVVLGGHICTEVAAEALLACSKSPSKYGRRSAIHALFHLAEWMPHKSAEVVAALDQAALEDSEPLLREFAKSMARDVRARAYEHMTEPLFPEER